MLRGLLGAAAAMILTVAGAYAAIGTAAGGGHSVSFGYAGDNGPGFWGRLDSQWSLCSKGARQSPIDIRRARVDVALRPLDLVLGSTRITLSNNGHGIELSYEPGSALTLNGVPYVLQQVHFHTLAEHVIGDWRGAMEMHAVFKDPRSGKLAVIGVDFRLGRRNGFLVKLAAHGLPEHTGDTVHSPERVSVAEALTTPGSYYTYLGSLTTPPCSQSVTWFVLKRPAQLSQAQLSLFERILGNNFRPIQPTNGRAVLATATAVRGVAG